MISTSPSASARGAERRSFPLVAAKGVGLWLDDPGLEQALQRAISGRSELYETRTHEADVVITDRAVTSDEFGRAQVLRVGRGGAGRNLLATLDPSVILSAASLLAAGYDLRARDPEPVGDRPAHLSQRERQVASLLVDGASNKVIARALEISVHTAKFHVTAILEKLGARNRADAVAIILREGLVAI